MIQGDPVIDPLPVHGRRLIPVHRSPENDRSIRPARFVNRTERTDVIYILPYVDRCQDHQGQQDFQNDMSALFITFYHFFSLFALRSVSPAADRRAPSTGIPSVPYARIPL